MNRTFLALAAASIAGTLSFSAAAQSSVTIFGRADLGLFKQNSGTTPINGGVPTNTAGYDKLQLKQGSANRIGFKGTEDLGGGNSVNFYLEQRFNLETGALDATPFARTTVELASKTAGSVYMGRYDIPVFWPSFRVDPFGYDTVGSPGPKHQLANYTIDGGIRTNGTLGYRSPDMNGFTTNLAYSFGKTARANSFGWNVEYRKGPWFVGGGGDRLNSQQKVTLISAAYDFGAVRPAFSYTRSTVAGVNNTNVTIAATAPLGNGVFKAAVARLDPAGANNTNTRMSMGYEYRLSKRTSLYGDIGTAKQQGTIAGNAYSRTTLFDLGVKHNF